MASNLPAFTAILLAAQRQGRLDPLAERAGVSHKCLVPIKGRPLIVHVLDILAATPGLGRIRICIEPEAASEVAAAWPAPEGLVLDFVDSADNLADSVYNAAQGIDGAMIITTADNVLLTPGAVAQVLAALPSERGTAVALATRSAVLAAHPEAQRRFYRLADDEYSNCNLYAVSGQDALKASEVFRTGGQFVRNPKRMALAFGLFNVLLVRYRLVSMAQAMRRLSKRLGLRIVPVVIADGTHAVDVDNERTYDIAASLLERRESQKV